MIDHLGVVNDMTSEVYWKTLPKPSKEIEQSLVLGKDEEILTAWGGKAALFRSRKPDKLAAVPKIKSWREGALILTNEKLVWLTWKYGRFHLTQHINLEDVSQVLLPKHSDKKETIQITDNQGRFYSYKLKLREKKRTYPSSKPLLEAAILKRKEKIQTEGEETREEPLAVLKMRYAKGEITKEEYEEMRKTLKT